MASLLPALRGTQILTRLPQAAISQANYSSEVKPRELNTASMKRGRGGRSSFSGDVVTVFGANGFIGRGIANRLGKNGSQMIFPYRGEHYKMMRLKVVGDLGQVLFCPMEIKDEESIRRAVSHSNIVINLVGRGWETSNFSYEDVNITGPARIARLAKEAGVKRFIHMSHINAKENIETAFLPKGSQFLKSKYQGELAVRAEFPEATIFRAADVYGQGDSFLNYWCSQFRRNKLALSLFGKGEMTVKQPVWHTDLITGIMNSLHDPMAVGQIYEGLGPERLTQRELLTYIYACTTRTEVEGTFSVGELMLDPKTFAKAFVINKLPFGNVNVFHNTTIDRLERDALSDESQGYPNLNDLGVKMHTLGDKIPWEVAPWDLHSYYEYEDVAEVPVVAPPSILTVAQERAISARRSNGLMALIPGF